MTIKQVDLETGREIPPEEFLREEAKEPGENIEMRYRFDFIALYQGPHLDDELFLHWGLMSSDAADYWQIPDPQSNTEFPPNSVVWMTSDNQPCAIHSLFMPDSSQANSKTVSLELKVKEGQRDYLSFVLYEKKWDAWHNNDGRNYNINLSLDKFRQYSKNTSITVEREVAEYLELHELKHKLKPRDVREHYLGLTPEKVESHLRELVMRTFDLRNVQGQGDEVPREVFVLRDEGDKATFVKGSELYRKIHSSFKDMLRVKSFSWRDEELQVFDHEH